MMNFSRFEKNLALYGADLSRWPRPDLKPALQLVAEDARAAALFAAAEQADHALRFAAREAAVPQGLAERIVRQARYVPQVMTPRPWLFEKKERAGVSLILAAVLGFMVSFSSERSPAFAADGFFYMEAPLYVAPVMMDDE